MPFYALCMLLTYASQKTSISYIMMKWVDYIKLYKNTVNIDLAESTLPLTFC